MSTLAPAAGAPGRAVSDPGAVVPRPRWARALARLRASRSLSRWNHILIPEKKPDRDRFRTSLFGRLVAFFFVLHTSFSREGRALLALTILVGFAGLDVRDTQVHQLFTMLAGVMCASLVMRPFFRLRGVRLVIDVPRRVAAHEPVRFDVRVENDSAERATSLRVEGPFLPWDGKWVRRAGGLATVESRGRGAVVAEAVFVARGEHHLDAFEAGALVPLGLAVGPRISSDGVRFVVVPRLANVVSLRVEHRLPDRRFASIASRQPGESDIAGVRPYRPGDPLKHLHVRTWARTGAPHVRQYADERSDRVALVVLVDGAEATERTKEAALSLAAGAAARLAEHDGGVDLLFVDARAFRVEPRVGVRALDAVLDRLAVHPLTQAEQPVVEAIAERVAGLSSVVLISAGVTRRAQAVADDARRRGLPCRWTAVVSPDDDATGTGEGARRVSPAAIEAKEAIAL